MTPLPKPKQHIRATILAHDTPAAYLNERILYGGPPDKVVCQVCGREWDSLSPCALCYSSHTAPQRLIDGYMMGARRV